MSPDWNPKKKTTRAGETGNDSRLILLTPHLFLHHADDFNVEILQELLVLQVKLVPASVLRRPQPLRPVLVAFDPSSLHFLSHHCDDVRLVFPDHLPKGRDRGGQGALAGDVQMFLISDLHADVAGVDVVLVVSNGNTSFVVLKNEETDEAKQSFLNEAHIFKKNKH